MVVNELNIDELVDGQLDFLVSLGLEYVPKLKQEHGSNVNYIGREKFSPSHSTGYITTNLIPYLVLTEKSPVTINYTERCVEARIVTPDNITYIGHGNSIADSVSRAFVLLRFNEKLVKFDYDQVLH